MISSSEHETGSTSSQHQKDRALLATMILRSGSKQCNPTTISKPLDNRTITENRMNDNSETNLSSDNRFPKTYSCNKFDLSKLKQEQENDPIIQNIIK